MSKRVKSVPSEKQPRIRMRDSVKILSDNLFPVVGIGASAGGLDAFKQVIQTIPEDSGMAFILVQHLDPLHESILSELLQRVTKIPVIEIRNNIRVAPNHIYIIPSNKMLIANDGVLLLSPRAKNQNHLPIDVFFSSLADVHQSHAIGVVLSGTGADGTSGLLAIRAQGGITIAQQTDSATYPGMPQSAIDSGAANFVLPLKEIIPKLAKLSLDNRREPEVDEGEKTSKEKGDAILRQIISLIRIRRGVDFTYYKQPTIQRRIRRRMAFNDITAYQDYFNYLQDHKEEQDLLYQDLLIPVTSFFRDPASFEEMKEKAFSIILQEKSTMVPLRIWVAGCSTGEEAYSFGICLSEFLGDKFASIKIQIFASDISSAAIAKARTGIYSREEVTGVSQERLSTYFTKINGEYHVNKSIRDLCLFAHHNFLKDPPFARVDLISCRNVLIYFQPFLQKKAFETFHYALNDKRFLVLGKSENVSVHTDLFNASSKRKIFVKKDNVERSRNRGSAESERAVKQSRENSASTGPRQEAYQKNVDDIILFKYSAVGVILNDQLDIVQFRGSTSAYLEAPAGKATLNVLKMAKGNLGYELRAALNEVRTNNEPVIKAGIVLDPENHILSLEVIPLLTTIEPYFLVLFHSETPDPASLLTKVETTNGSPAKLRNNLRDARILSLEKEITRVKAEMRNMNEEQEAANEELQSANEELLSGSEELQSLNEELETTKEEIQSTNEELSIVNHELIDRNHQLTQSRQFAEAIVATLHEPLLILSNDLRILSANQSFHDTFNLSEQQTLGKTLYELQDAQWDIPALRQKLMEIQTHKSDYAEWEVTGKFDNIELHMGLHAQSIQNGKDLQLILLAIEDITLRKNEEERRKSFSEDLEKQIADRTWTLQKVNMELGRANENLNQFVFIASHDLQEPLRKLQVYVSQLTAARNNLSVGVKGIVEKVGHAAVRMSDLIRDVLAFSTISSIESSYVKTDLNVILQKVVIDLDLLITEKQASINIEVLPIIKAVPILINQLFTNLLSNALKFSDKEKVGISITSRTLLPVEVLKHPDLNNRLSYCEIAVSDNGIGFDQAYADKIFEIFQQLSKAHTGTGIGLALCKKIVNLHQGRIFAEGAAGEGATFFLQLPLFNEGLTKVSVVTV